MVTCDAGHLNLRKENGLVAEVFQQHHMNQLRVSDKTSRPRYQIDPTPATQS